MQKRTWLALSFACIVVFAFAGCKQGNPEPEEKKVGNSESYANKMMNSPSMSEQQKQMIKQGMEARGQAKGGN